MRQFVSFRTSQQFFESAVVVIPAHNEATRIKRVLASIKKSGFKCVVVDDGSIDNTAIIAQKYTPHVLRSKFNQGKSNAIKKGCNYAVRRLGAKALVLFDGDGQHEVADIAPFLTVLARHPGAIISGRRQGNDWLSMTKKLGKLAIILEILVLFRRLYRDPLCGLKAFNVTTYKKMAFVSSGYNLEAEILLKICHNDLDLIELPIASLPEQTLKQGCQPIDGLKIMFYILQQRLFKNH